MIDLPSKVKGVGKLDISRGVLSDALELDALLRRGVSFEAPEMKEYLRDIDSGLHFLGQLCIADGTMYKPSDDFDTLDPDEVLRLDIDVDQRDIAIGKYMGVTVIRAGNGRGSVESRLVHVVEDLSSQEHFDRRGNRIELTGNTYFSVDGGDVTPVEPLDAHSMMKLDRDAGAEDIENVVFGDYRSELERFRAITALLTVLLNTRSPVVDLKTHDRISYFNSLNPFDGMVMEGSEFLVGDLLNGVPLSSQSFSLGWTDNPTEVDPIRVVYLDGFRRLSPRAVRTTGYTARILKRREPYIRARADDLDVVIAMRNVTDIA